MQGCEEKAAYARADGWLIVDCFRLTCRMDRCFIEYVGWMGVGWLKGWSIG